MCSSDLLVMSPPSSSRYASVNTLRNSSIPFSAASMIFDSAICIIRLCCSIVGFVFICGTNVTVYSDNNHYICENNLLNI